MGTYHVTERFVSINGEARRAGELSCFIRLAGCNLRCNYCDTRWSCDPDAPSELLSEEELYTWVKETGITNVTLTGGEPLLAPDVDQLLLRLSLIRLLVILLLRLFLIRLRGLAPLGEGLLRHSAEFVFISIIVHRIHLFS